MAVAVTDYHQCSETSDSTTLDCLANTVQSYEILVEIELCRIDLIHFFLQMMFNLFD
jgi:hypothetical protein